MSSFKIFITQYMKSIYQIVIDIRKPRTDDDVKAMIRRNFTYEYEFYYFCKQRLYKQYLAINLIKLQAKKKTLLFKIK